jgi:hypothetical protein
MAQGNVESIYPLSPLQQGMLFHTLFAPHTGVYFQQLNCVLRGEIDAGALRKAWERVVARHGALRTCFLWEEVDNPLQVVRKHVKLPWQEHDWSDVPAE